MTITLQPETERYLEDQAKKQGLDNASQYVERLIQRDQNERDVPEGDVPEGETVDQYLDRIRGSLKTGLTTEQIMDLTRSEV